jgi:hypothetical protein
MAGSVEFNGQKMIKELDLFTRTQLPWIATKTLQGLANQVQVDLREHQEMTFDHIGRETKKFIVFPSTKTKLETTIKHKDEAAKGTAPADYLRPQVIGGPATRTRIQRRLVAKGRMASSSYMVPTDSEGRVSWPAKGSRYTKALWGIAAMEELRGTIASSGKNRGADVYAANSAKKYQSHGSYVHVPADIAAAAAFDPLQKRRANVIRAMNKGAGKPFNRSLPSPGIYKVKKNSLEPIMQELERIPTFRGNHYKFHKTARTSVQENAQKIFDEMVRKYGS